MDNIQSPIVSPCKKEGALLGRKCTRCKRFKEWEFFDKKATGKNGYDSRCKSCIGKVKKVKRSSLKKAKRKPETFEIKIVGEIGEEAIESLGMVLGSSIRSLIDAGKL